jgi:uncharacterized protein (TIGR03000 family)
LHIFASKGRGNGGTRVLDLFPLAGKDQRFLSKLKVASLATAALLVFAGDSPAQHGGGGHGGGFGGGHGGFVGHGGGFGGFRGGGRGFGRDGFGYGGWGYGGLGLGYGLYDGGYGYYDGGYYAPAYSTGPYYNSYDYAPYTQDYAPYYSTGITPQSGYLSYYPPETGYGQPNNNTASVEVKVPANAELWFDGQKTNQSGSDRHFVTPALCPGKTFNYEVRATWTDAQGQQVTRTRDVQVQANQSTIVNFMGSKDSKP